MLDRNEFAGWNYAQPGQQCVLAAYGAALWPSTSRSAIDYFDAYCSHFGLSVSSGAEASYDADFHLRAASTPGGGFGLLHCLHSNSAQPAFADARRIGLTFLADGAAAWHHIHSELRVRPRATAQIFVNDNPGSPFGRMHSVCLSMDAGGLYAYDSQPPGTLVSLPGGQAQLGLIGNALLFVP